jgi:hypothetical protein
MAYTPDRGDVVWIDLDPQADHEQAGRRPARYPGQFIMTLAWPYYVLSQVGLKTTLLRLLYHQGLR